MREWEINSGVLDLRDRRQQTLVILRAGALHMCFWSLLSKLNSQVAFFFPFFLFLTAVIVIVHTLLVAPVSPPTLR